MKKYLLLQLEIASDEVFLIFNEFYKNIINTLKIMNFEVNENLEDPDGYLFIKNDQMEFGLTTPIFGYDPVTCGIYLEQSPGEDLKDNTIIKSIMPFIENIVDQLEKKSIKTWFSTKVDMLKKIREIYKY